MALGQRLRKAPVLSQRPDIHRPQPSPHTTHNPVPCFVRPEPHRVEQGKVAPAPSAPGSSTGAPGVSRLELRRIGRVQVIEHHPIEAADVDRLDILQQAGRKWAVRLVVGQGHAPAAPARPGTESGSPWRCALRRRTQRRSTADCRAACRRDSRNARRLDAVT